MVQSNGGKSAINMYSSGIAGRMKRILKENGPGFLACKTAAFAWRSVYAALFLRFRRERTFMFGGESYRYFYHPYNFTWDNERSVEIPIAKRFLDCVSGVRALEVGNVLPYYFIHSWDVLDKFDGGSSVIREDVVEYSPAEKYDIVISISTLEHVGFDDDVKEPEKIVKAMDNLKRNCLKQGGSMLFTMPLGYNPFLDRMLFGGELGFDSVSFLKRVSKTEWREVPKKELGDYLYASEYIEASAIVVARYGGGEK